MKKTIHIYSQYYFPISNAVSIRTREYILALKDCYDIKVITGMPNYPYGIKDKKYKYKLIKKENGELGENVIRTFEFASKNEGSFFRLLNYISFMLSSFFYGLFSKKPDLIIVISPPLFVAISVYFISKIRNIKFISEIHDLWPDSVVALGYMKKETILFKIFKYLEIKIYNNSESIIGLTKGVVKGIKENLINTDKVILNYFVVNNILDKKLFNPYISLKEKIKNRQIAIFAGNMNEAYDFGKTAKFIEKNNDIFFVFIGDGSKKIYLEQSTISFDNIVFLDRMNKNKVDEYLYYSDIILVPLKDEKFYNGTFPVKGIEGIVNNKKIIFFGPKDGEFAIFLEKFKKGLENKEIFSSDYFGKNIKNLITKII